MMKEANCHYNENDETQKNFYQIYYELIVKYTTKNMKMLEVAENMKHLEKSKCKYQIIFFSLKIPIRGEVQELYNFIYFLFFRNCKEYYNG